MPGDERDSRIPEAGCGASLPGSFGRFIPGSSSLRTWQLSLNGEWSKFSGTLPASGSMRNGVLSVRPRSERRTEEKESSSWATPQRRDGDGRSPRAKRWGDPKRHGGYNLDDQVEALWPTPNASVANDGEQPETWRARAAKLKEKHGNGNGAGTPLSIAAQEFWPTPNVPNGGRTVSSETIATRGRTATGKVQLDLGCVARQWATPSASPWRSGEASEETREKNSRPLNEQVLWSTPRVANASIYAESDETAIARGRRHEPTLARQACSLLAPPTESDGQDSSFNIQALHRRSPRRRLNECFVEWLMGFPLEFSDGAPKTELPVCEPSETLFARWQQRMRGWLSRRG